jgi:pimeloyl-ACP methyl ester carboxylesterase
MGGWSALLYGERHPDLYSFVGSVSGVPEMSDVRFPEVGPVLEAVGYLHSQGYDALPLLLPNGDGGIVVPGDLVAPDCLSHPHPAARTS